MQSIFRLLRHFKMGQPRMGSTEWANPEGSSPQRRGTAGCHALNRSLPDPEAAPAGKGADRKREPAAHDLVRPGTGASPDARKERAKKEKKGNGFPPHPGLPGERQLLPVHPRRRASGGWHRGTSPLSPRGHSSRCPQEPHDVCRERRELHGRARAVDRNTRHVHSTYRTGGSPGKGTWPGVRPGMTPCG